MPLYRALLGLGPLALALGCHAPPSEASAPARSGDEAAPKASEPKITPQPSPTKAREDTVTVRGTVEAIRLHNINKALHHYTFNVEIELRHDGVERAGSFDPARVPNPLVVRVDKVFWSELSQAERDSVAPNGPEAVLQPMRWKDLEVGQAVDMDVTFTSPSLAHRVR